MTKKSSKVLQPVSGWKAVELIFQCIFIGLWQISQILIKNLWKGHHRKLSKNIVPVELTVDSSFGTHYYIKILGVKYHYVETGPKDGKYVLILGDAPNNRNLWAQGWSEVVRRLAESGHRVITLDLRGTGGSEGGNRIELSPPSAIRELYSLLVAHGVTENEPAVVIGFGIGGMLTWYLAHCYGAMISKFAVVGAPHPNLYWKYPPAAFCQQALHFIQWPYFPERWLASGESKESEGWASSRACDWQGALNYVRGCAWWRVRSGHKTSPPALLVGEHQAATQLVLSAQYCSTYTLRLVNTPAPTDLELPAFMLDFLIVPVKKREVEEEPSRGLVGRVLGAMAGRGRELTARLTQT